MKICESCGMEYGSDNSFCPFCDERYGVVILVNDVISADGLPPYKEEFPVIGETGVKQENFAANRDEIYKRNIRLAARENFLPKMEVRAAYKPIAPLAEISGNGAISPYKPPNPIVEKLNSIRKKIKTIKLNKTGKTVLSALSVAAVFLLIIGVSWFETTDTYIDYQNEKTQKQYEKQAEYAEAAEEAVDANLDYSYIYGKDGAVMKLALFNDSEKQILYRFTFENKTGKTLYDFTELFAGAEGMRKFDKMIVSYPGGAIGQILIIDGVPAVESEEFILPVLEPIYPEDDTKYYRTIKPDEKVSGYLSVLIPENIQQTSIASENTYADNGEMPAVKTPVPEEITITSESGLEMKLTLQSKAEYFGYSFEFTNTTDRYLDSFYDEFTGAEYMDKVCAMWITASGGNSVMSAVHWDDGIPHTDQPYTVKPNETISGTITLDFRYTD